MTVQAKVPMNFRIAPAGRAWVQQVAEAHEVDMTDVMRAALKLARQHRKELDAILREDAS